MATSASRTAAAVREIGGRIAYRLLDGLQQSEQSASGELEQSIDPRFTFEADKITIDVYMANYGYWVDAGRKRGNPPPFSAIYTWLTYPNVMDRLNAGSSYKTKLSANMPYTERAHIADLIRRKIAAKGTKGNNFIRNVTEDDGLWNDASAALADGAQADLVAEIDELLGQFKR